AGAGARPRGGGGGARGPHARVLGTKVVGRPITVTTTPEGRRTTMFRGHVVWGGMFTTHVLRKAALYFP
ncbi:hypothetical protein ACFXAZ_12870, partial [Streptomyces sp. NPDC059477]